MRQYSKMVIHLVAAGAIIIVLIVIGIVFALSRNNKHQIEEKARSSQMLKQLSESQGTAIQAKSKVEAAKVFIETLLNYSSLNDFKQSVKPLAAKKVYEVLEKSAPNFSKGNDIQVYSDSKGHYLAYGVQTLSAQVSQVVVYLMTLEKTSQGYRVQEIQEPRMQDGKGFYLNTYKQSERLGIIESSSKEVKQANAFMSGFNNFSSINDHKEKIKPFLTSDIQKSLAVNQLSANSSLISKMNSCSLWASGNNHYLALVSVTINGQSSIQLYQFTFEWIKGQYLVSQFSQPTQQ